MMAATDSVNSCQLPIFTVLADRERRQLLVRYFPKIDVRFLY
jgi:hypothetical protein